MNLETTRDGARVRAQRVSPARVVTNGDYAHRELAENLTEHHHHHLVCSNCSAVQDVEMSANLEDAVHQAV